MVGCFSLIASHKKYVIKSRKIMSGEQFLYKVWWLQVELKMLRGMDDKLIV